MSGFSLFLASVRFREIPRAVDGYAESPHVIWIRRSTCIVLFPPTKKMLGNSGPFQGSVWTHRTPLGFKRRSATGALPIY